MLKFSTLAACALVLGGTAAEIPANRHALDEAALFFSNACEVTDAAHAKGCRELQGQFQFDYLRAMSGETLSMENLASYFSTGNHGTVSPSRLRSCAWAIMAEMSPRPPEDGSSVDGQIDAFCQDISENDMVAAKHLAAVTTASIARAPTKPPRQADGDRWPGDGCETFVVSSAARGRFAPPLCSRRTGPLDASVAPLVP